MHGFKPAGPLADTRDPRADRRFSYAKAAAADGAWREAAEVLSQVIELAPDWVAAWVAMGDAQTAAGDASAAADAFREALRLDPADGLGAALRLAALAPGSLPAAAAPAYVEALFDAYAPRFERHLTTALAYRGPSDLAEALSEVCDHPLSHTIDLGCGTGLGGVAFRPLTAILTGVDLSTNMVAEAKAKGLYDRLAVGEIIGFLRDEPPGSADLIIAADVFVYIGDPAPVMTAAARVLRPGGFFAFTAQRCETGIAIGPDMRFAHATTTIAESLKRCGFDPLILRDKRARQEKGQDVPGLVAVAVRL